MTRDEKANATEHAKFKAAGWRDVEDTAKARLERLERKIHRYNEIPPTRSWVWPHKGEQQHG